MKTTYFLTHESIDAYNCPICGKLLRESRYYDEVACSDPQCRFNDSQREHGMWSFIEELTKEVLGDDKVRVGRQSMGAKDY